MPFRIRFKNHKSSLNEFGRGQRGICWEHLYSYFYEEGHSRLQDILAQIIDITDVRKQIERETF